jgi:hypothetical protein
MAGFAVPAWKLALLHRSANSEALDAQRFADTLASANQVVAPFP